MGQHEWECWKILIGFGYNLSCPSWQAIFFKGNQWGAINLSRVMHAQRWRGVIKGRGERGKESVQGWAAQGEDEKGGVELLRDRQRVREQSGDIKRQMEPGLTDGEAQWSKVEPTPEMTCCRWLTMNRRSSKPLSRNLLSYCGSPTCSSHSPTGWSRALPQAPSAERGKRFSSEKPFSR